MSGHIESPGFPKVYPDDYNNTYIMFSMKKSSIYLQVCTKQWNIKDKKPFNQYIKYWLNYRSLESDNRYISVIFFPISFKSVDWNMFYYGCHGGHYYITNMVSKYFSDLKNLWLCLYVYLICSQYLSYVTYNENKALQSRVLLFS